MRKFQGLLLSTLMLVLLAPFALAADNNSAKVYVPETVTINNTTLKPGNYTFAWQGSGSNVKVDIKSGKKTLTSADATVKNTNDRPFTNTILQNKDNGKQMLSGIRLKDGTQLQFSGNAPGQESGSTSGSSPRR
ncbi:MAG TPA: hypothetical protein VFU76_04830 [Terriglobales bacterium]|nr:hypothetical protein [Terriglobales bacterium]